MKASTFFRFSVHLPKDQGVADPSQCSAGIHERSLGEVPGAAKPLQDRLELSPMFATTTMLTRKPRPAPSSAKNMSSSPAG